MPNKKNPARTPRTADKDAPLKEDIRLLGRLLGEVIRHQEGETVFEVVETIRQTAVRFRRESDPQAGADQRRRLIQALALGAGPGGFERMRASLRDAAP